MSTVENPLTIGVHHVGFNVPDLKQTCDFFISILGFKQIGEVADYPAIFVSDGSIMLTLWQAENPEKAVPFDRKNNIGLHHLALRVENADALDELYNKLSQLDEVEIEFAPEPLAGGPTKHMMCYIPSGIRIEFIALA